MRFLFILALVPSATSCVRLGFGDRSPPAQDPDGAYDSGPHDSAGAAEVGVADARPWDGPTPEGDLRLDDGAAADRLAVDLSPPPDSGPISGMVQLATKQIGGSGSDYVYGVAVDLAGNVYLAGSFQGTVDFGGGPQTAAGGSDVFVTSYDTALVHRWTQTFGSPTNDSAVGVGTDSQGNVYVAGSVTGKVSMGGPPEGFGGMEDLFVVSYTGAGAYRWSDVVGDSMTQRAGSLAVDPAGNLYVAGSFDGTFNFGGGNTLTSNGGFDAFLISYGPGGSYRWSKHWGAGSLTNYDYGDVVGAGPTGDVFHGMALNTSSPAYNYFASHDSGGTARWSKAVPSGVRGNGMVVDPSANLYITGYFYYSPTLGSDTLVSQGSHDLLLMSYDTVGNVRWAKGFGGTGPDAGRGIALGPDGRLYVAGRFNDSVDFGGGVRVSQGGDDVVLAIYTTQGAHLFTLTYGGTGNDIGRAVAVDGSGSAYLAATFEQTVKLGLTFYSSSGSTDIFLAKLKPSP